MSSCASDDEAGAEKRTRPEDAARVPGTQSSCSDSGRGSIRWNSLDDSEPNSRSTTVQLRRLELHATSNRNSVTSPLQWTRKYTSETAETSRVIKAGIPRHRHRHGHPPEDPRRHVRHARLPVIPVAVWTTRSHSRDDPREDVGEDVGVGVGVVECQL